MSKFVRLDIYSGVPNPVWEIDEGYAAELLEQSGGVEVGLAVQTPALGYRGFTIIDSSESTSDAKVMTESALVSFEEQQSFFGMPDVERAILEAGQGAGAIDAELAAYISGALDNPDVITEGAAEAVVTCPPCGGGAAPAYDPGYWNNDPTRLRNNNCYNYANNKATNTFAQPGRASGHQLTALTCPNVNAAAVSDGLVNIPNFNASIPGWYVALVIWPGRDYHWYRQDKVGCWSHKPGSTNARNVDSSGNRITDPATCDRGPYTNFCTYMTTKPNANIN